MLEHFSRPVYKVTFYVQIKTEHFPDDNIKTQEQPSSKVGKMIDLVSKSSNMSRTSSDTSCNIQASSTSAPSFSSPSVSANACDRGSSSLFVNLCDFNDTNIDLHMKSSSTVATAAVHDTINQGIIDLGEEDQQEEDAEEVWEEVVFNTMLI